MQLVLLINPMSLNSSTFLNFVPAGVISSVSGFRVTADLVQRSPPPLKYAHVLGRALAGSSSQDLSTSVSLQVMARLASEDEIFVVMSVEDGHHGSGMISFPMHPAIQFHGQKISD